MFFSAPIRIKYKPFLIVFTICFFSLSIFRQASAQEVMSIYLWDISIDTATGKTSLSYNGTSVISENQAAFKLGSEHYLLEDLDDLAVETEPVHDRFGPGTMVKISATGLNGNLHFLQTYYVYEDHPFLLTEFSLSSDDVISSNYMAPIYTEKVSSFLPAGQNTVLWVPFDNDKWVRYRAYDFGRTTTSYEVGAFFNPATRRGLIAGSIEHDNWKTGVKSVTQASNSISNLEVFGGVTSDDTRDNLLHGALRGTALNLL